MLVEKREDVGGDASKSNSATIVTGYDAPVGSLESYLSVHSNPMFDRVTQELDVEFKRIGALQVGFTDEDIEVLKENKEKAIANGVMDVELLSGDEVRKMEPSLSKEIKAGLYLSLIHISFAKDGAQAEQGGKDLSGDQARDGDGYAEADAVPHTIDVDQIHA